MALINLTASALAAGLSFTSPNYDVTPVNFTDDTELSCSSVSEFDHGIAAMIASARDLEVQLLPQLGHYNIQTMYSFATLKSAVSDYAAACPDESANKDGQICDSQDDFTEAFKISYRQDAEARGMSNDLIEAVIDQMAGEPRIMSVIGTNYRLGLGCE